MQYLIMAFVVIFLFVIVVGAGVTKRTLGVLIDTRNKISLSQFQMVLWTWILLSGFAGIVAVRLVAGVEDPLGVTWDERLWGLLGISVGSAVASGAVSNVKKGKEPAPAALAAAVARLPVNVQQQGIRREGLLVTNATPKDASFWDMFRGEEPANYSLLDIGKVQMFVFTMVAALAYAVALFQLVGSSSAEDLRAMPRLSEGLVFILGISHVGYLGNKWTDKQPVADKTVESHVTTSSAT